MSHSEQMINQNPIVSARQALRFTYPDIESAQVFALIAIAEQLQNLGQKAIWPTVDDHGVGEAGQPVWPDGGGYSPDGNSWVCPDGGCGYGVAGPSLEDPVMDHLEEHRRGAEYRWHSAHVIKVKISDRFSNYLIHDELTEGFRAADGSFHTIDSIIESGSEVTVIEP